MKILLLGYEGMLGSDLFSLLNRITMWWEKTSMILILPPIMIAGAL